MGRAETVWDEQYREGLWKREALSPYVLDRVAQLCNGGKLFEFGCGCGLLPRNLPKGTFSSYLGIDISAVAINEAVRLAEKSGVERCRFVHSDMAKWPGDEGIDLIVLQECVYYLNIRDLKFFLGCCCASLSPNGSILIVVHSADKHRKSLDVCRRICRVLREETIGQRVYLTAIAK